MSGTTHIDKTKKVGITLPISLIKQTDILYFSLEELHFIFSELKRVVTPRGFNFFSVRNQNDNSYGTGIEIEKGIYDINGFQIRFFTEKEIRDLTMAEGFEILWIKEEYEEPVTLFLVSSRRL
jgi:predicted TPR repeat methyltransferase